MTQKGLQLQTKNFNLEEFLTTNGFSVERLSIDDGNRYVIRDGARPVGSVRDTHSGLTTRILDEHYQDDFVKLMPQIEQGLGRQGTLLLYQNAGKAERGFFPVNYQKAELPVLQAQPARDVLISLKKLISTGAAATFTAGVLGYHAFNSEGPVGQQVLMMRAYDIGKGIIQHFS